LCLRGHQKLALRGSNFRLSPCSCGSSHITGIVAIRGGRELCRRISSSKIFDAERLTKARLSAYYCGYYAYDVALCSHGAVWVGGRGAGNCGIPFRAATNMASRGGCWSASHIGVYIGCPAHDTTRVQSVVVLTKGCLPLSD